MTKALYDKIKFIREQNNFSQEYIANKLRVSRPTYIQIEKGKRELTLSEAKKIASIFSLSLTDFLGKETFKKPKIILKNETIDKKKKNDIRIIMSHANVKKFKETLLYVLNKIGAKPNIGETALYKILYFIDFDFYEKFEVQLTGAQYMKNHYGPTPIEFEKIIKNMEEKGELERVKSKYFHYDQKKYLPRREPELTNLSAQEIKHIDEVLARLSDKNAQELTEYSHSDTPWLVHKNGEIISYETVFYRDQDHSVRNYEDEF